MQRIGKVACWIYEHIYNFIAGLILAFVGYFSPIEGIVYVSIGAIIIDLIIGLGVAIYLGDAIVSRKLWRTAFKLTACLLLIHLSYAASHEIGYFNMHVFMAWGIVGFEIWSILETITKVYDRGIFSFLKRVMEVNVEKRTGAKLNNDKEC